MQQHPLLGALALALILGLGGCSTSPNPSHGAENIPSGVSVYGTVDVGIGKGR